MEGRNPVGGSQGYPVVLNTVDLYRLGHGKKSFFGILWLQALEPRYYQMRVHSYGISLGFVHVIVVMQQCRSVLPLSLGAGGWSVLQSPSRLPLSYQTAK